MGKLTHPEFISLLIAMGTMLLGARLAAELARLLRMPVVTGEILIGILLGPSIFGLAYPQTFANLFPLYGSVGIALDGITKISAVLLLFVSGMEVQMQLVLKQRKAAFSTSLLGIVFPFAVGAYLAWFFPEKFAASYHDKLLFSLFMGTAMAISALPVIARTLMDLNLFRTRLGMIILASAMFDDLIGWLIFSLIISIMGKGKDPNIIWLEISIILGYGIFMLSIGKKLIDKSLPWIQKKFAWPGGILSLSLVACFYSAAFTESLGIHAVLGAFIAGIAVGDSVKLNERAREIIHQFVTNIFAPLFFVSIGLKVNFVDNFSASVTGWVLLIAYVGKMSGATLGARIGGFKWNEALAVGAGMNARGAMEIILGTLALQAGLIQETLFVSLVIMALVTSLTSGPLIKLFLGRSGFEGLVSQPGKG
jgi:Kef-type K+ transport system membrane component KefB